MEEYNILDECPVEILQNSWEFEKLISEYVGCRAKNILEIGSFYGGTLWYWLRYGRSSLKKVISIDYPVPPSDGRFEKMMECRREWQLWVNMYSPDAEFYSVNGDSTDPNTIETAAICLKVDLLDFLFIDGGHDYKTVKSDYDNYSKFVKPGGIIVLHDIMGLEEVRKFWNELKVSNIRYKEICDKNGWGIGIIYV